MNQDDYISTSSDKGVNDPEEYILEAIRKGLFRIGFSEQEVLELKK